MESEFNKPLEEMKKLRLRAGRSEPCYGARSISNHGTSRTNIPHYLGFGTAAYI